MMGHQYRRTVSFGPRAHLALQALEESTGIAKAAIVEYLIIRQAAFKGVLPDPEHVEAFKEGVRAKDEQRLAAKTRAETRKDSETLAGARGAFGPAWRAF